MPPTNFEEPNNGQKAAGGTGKYVAKKAGKKVVNGVGATVTSAPVLMGVGFVLVILLIAGIFFVVIMFSLSSGQQERSEGGEISSNGREAIPAKYIPIYKSAAEKYGVPWNLLAAIHRVETNFSSGDMVSSVGAIGPTQFMTCSWIGWNYPGCTGLGDVDVSKDKLTDLSAIQRYGGYGIDGNGDGKADPWNVNDAIYSTAHYLASNGANEGLIRNAVFTYNHSWAYVQEVLDFADRYIEHSVPIDGELNGTVKEMLKASRKWIGNSQYVFGGGRTQDHIRRGIFDCSSFIHWAYRQIGLKLGPLSSVSTETLERLGRRIDSSQLKPGDLVFFKTYKVHGHVGIYLGNRKFIGAQSSSGVSIEDMNNSNWRSKFHGYARRVIKR